MGIAPDLKKKQSQLTFCNARLTGSFDSLQIYLCVLFSKYSSFYYASGNIFGTNKGDMQMMKGSSLLKKCMKQEYQKAVPQSERQ